MINLSEQEEKVNAFLMTRDNGFVAWQELAQFAKSPQNVKLRSCQKMVSEVRRKLKAAGMEVPWNVRFYSLTDANQPLNGDDIEIAPTIEAVVIKKMEEAPKQQVLVQVKRTPSGNPMIVNQAKPTLAAHIDFKLDIFTKSVMTRSGKHKLNDNEWNMFRYIHENAGRILSISELRDKVAFPQYGSKLPARWFDSIMRVINNLRRQVPELKDRLMTVKKEETSYLFQ